MRARAGVAPDLAADVEGRLGARDDVEDGELMLGDTRERLVGVGDGRDGVADVRQDAADELSGSRVGFDEQDGAGGQGASPVWSEMMMTDRPRILGRGAEPC